METVIFKEFTVILHKDDALSFVIYLDSNSIQGMCGYYEVLYDENRSHVQPDQTQLILYFPSDDREAGIRLDIIFAILGIEPAVITEKEISKTQYLESYKKHYKSFDISRRFVIVPSWEKEIVSIPEKSEKIILYLDPGLAFGTGLHPTTKLCMMYLDENPPAGNKVIDAGCGSGILTIGALLLGASEVFAFDVDGNAVLSVKNNLELNSGLDERVILKQGGFDLEEFALYPADLMMGNLTASIILPNKKRIDAGKFNKMLLSGILLEKEDEIIDAFSDGWQINYKNNLDGWSILSFERKTG